MRFVDDFKAFIGRSRAAPVAAGPATVGSRPRGNLRVRGASSNPDDPNAQNQWRRLGSASVRNLADFDHREMVRQSTRSAQSDGYARANERLISDATVGSQPVGPLVNVETKADRDTLQGFVDAFWEHPDNDLGPALREFMSGLTNTGSLCLTMHTGEDGDGRGSLATVVGYVDPESFVSPGVLTDPGNVRAPWAVLRAGFVTDEVIAHPIIRKDDTVHPFFAGHFGEVLTIPRTQRYGGALKVRVDVPCFYLGVNRAAPNQSVGISDVYPVLDLLGLIDELVFGAVQRSINIGAYSIIVKFPVGTDEKTITDRMAEIQGDLESGEGKAVGITSDVTIEAMHANLQAGEWATLEKTARTNALIGMGPWPIHVFSDGGTTNVATAAEQGSPISNLLLSRQSAFKTFILQVTLYAIRKIPEAVTLIDRNDDFALELPLPTIVAKDTTRESATLMNEVNIMLTSVSGDLITTDAAQREFREHANRYGFSIRPEDAPSAEDIEERSSMKGLPFPGLEPEPEKMNEGTPEKVEVEEAA